MKNAVTPPREARGRARRGSGAGSTSAWNRARRPTAVIACASRTRSGAIPSRTSTPSRRPTASSWTSGTAASRLRRPVLADGPVPDVRDGLGRPDADLVRAPARGHRDRRIPARQRAPDAGGRGAPAADVRLRRGRGGSRSSRARVDPRAAHVRGRTIGTWPSGLVHAPFARRRGDRPPGRGRAPPLRPHEGRGRGAGLGRRRAVARRRDAGGARTSSARWAF